MRKRGARRASCALRLGPKIAGWLDDDTVVEVMLNPDGRLWLDRLKSGLEDAVGRLSPEDGERIVAHHVGAEVHAGAPRVSAELPETGARFESLLPPVVAAPSFAIRKPAVAVFTLDDYLPGGDTAKEYFACLPMAYRTPLERPVSKNGPEGPSLSS
jgi:type IV secretion system protein VirB11